MSIHEQTPWRGYPLPVSLNPVGEDVDVLRAALQAADGDVHNLLIALSGAAPRDHVHVMEDVDGLLSALDGKADFDHDHTLGGLRNVLAAVDMAAAGSILYKTAAGWAAGNPATILGPHQHTIENIEGLVPALAGKTTPAEVAAAISAAIAALVGAAPGQLDAIDELANAIANDPNFAATMTAQLAAKLAKAANLSDLPDPVAARSNLKIWTGTEAAYIAIPVKDPQTLYFIT